MEIKHKIFYIINRVYKNKVFIALLVHDIHLFKNKNFLQLPKPLAPTTKTFNYALVPIQSGNTISLSCIFFLLAVTQELRALLLPVPFMSALEALPFGLKPC